MRGSIVAIGVSRCARDFGKAALLLVVLLTLAANGQEQAVAEIDGTPVTRAQLEAFLKQVNPLMEYERLPESEQRRWIEEYVTRKLFAQEARAAGLDGDPEVRAKVEYFSDGVLAQAYREAAVKKIAVSAAEARGYYEKHREGFRIGPRVRGQQVIARTETAARDVLKRWQAGASLETIAGLRKTIPEIVLVERGWYASDTLPKALLEPLLAAEGEFHGPVQSGYGWHVFRIEERQPARVREFDEVKQEIEERLRQEKAQEVYARLLEEAKRKRGVKIFSAADER